MDSNKIKKGLGRGLSSLIGETKTEINTNKLSISDLVSNKISTAHFLCIHGKNIPVNGQELLQLLSVFLREM